MPGTRTSRLAWPVAILVLAVLIAAINLWLFARAPDRSRTSGLAAVFIGDSYTTGSDQGGIGDRNYTSIFAHDTGFNVQNLAVGGTGYTVSQPTAGTYLQQQLPELEKMTPPALIVVEGSRNDITTDPSRVETAATELYTRIKAENAASLTVVIGPVFPSKDGNNPQVSTLMRAVRDAASRAGIPFIDPVQEQWLPPELVGTDGVHPTDAGHARMASIVERDILPMLQQPGQ